MFPVRGTLDWAAKQKQEVVQAVAAVTMVVRELQQQRTATGGVDVHSDAETEAGEPDYFDNFVSRSWDDDRGKTGWERVFSGAWRRLTICLLWLLAVFYSAFYMGSDVDTEANVWNLLLWLSISTLVVSVVFLPDGIFYRPHPVVWRFVMGLNIVYLTGLLVLLYQSDADARRFMALYDPRLGVPLEYRDYASDCRVWVPEHPQKIPNLIGAMDRFVFSHFMGWFFKSWMMRDQTLCWIMSISWEFLEMALTKPLPNFAECWWDQWILDVLLANGLGIWVGHRLAEYLEVREFKWMGGYLKGTKGRLFSLLEVFTPQHWDSVRWNVTSSPRRFLGGLSLALIITLVELNGFLIKIALWMPAEQDLVVYRVFLWMFIGCPALRQAYQYYSDPSCKSLGMQAWLCLATAVVETFVAIKFRRDAFPPGTWSTVSAFIYSIIACIVAFSILALLTRNESDVLHEKRRRERKALKAQ